MKVEAFFFCLEVFLVDLAPGEVEAGVVCCYSARAAPEVSVEDGASRLRKQTVNPCVELYGLLRRMYLPGVSVVKGE